MTLYDSREASAEVRQHRCRSSALRPRPRPPSRKLSLRRAFAASPGGARGEPYSSSPDWAAFRRSSRQWMSWVCGCRHSLTRYSKPGSSTMGVGSGGAGATAPTTILASGGMNGDWAGGPVR